MQSVKWKQDGDLIMVEMLESSAESKKINT